MAVLVVRNREHADAGASGRHAAGMPEAVKHEGTLRAAFDRSSGSLYRFVAARTAGDLALADDIMQQVWLAALESRRDFSPGEADAWLRGVARNLLLALRRTVDCRRRHLAMSGTELARRLQEAPAGSELAARREVRQLLLLAITALPCETEHLLIRRYSHGATESQLAAELGITERAVEGRLRRARRALRDSLVQLDGEEGDHVVG